MRQVVSGAVRRVVVVFFAAVIVVSASAEASEWSRNPRSGREDPISRLVRVVKNTLRTLGDVVIIPRP